MHESDKDKLKIYVYRKFLLKDVRPVSLLMHTTDQDQQPDLLYWNKLREVLYSIVEVCYFDHLSESGQIVIIPHSLKEYRRRNTLKDIIHFSQDCIKQNKFVVAYDHGALHISPNHFSLQFRTNNTRGSGKSVTIPNWLYDLGYHSNLPALEQPLVGFSGNVEYPSRLNGIAKYVRLPHRWINHLACNLTIDEHLNVQTIKQMIARYVRQALLSQLTSFNQVKVDILSRSTSFFTESAETRNKLQSEYRSSIFNNIYFIVIRGDGQGFFQLYEIMSAGRIPIIIDTGVTLPSLRKYDWTDISLIVPFNELDTLEERIITFHANHSAQELEAKCQAARQAYEELLPHNYVPNIMLPMLTKGARTENIYA